MTLGLRARLTLAFLLVVCVLSGAGTWVLYERIGEQFQADFEARVGLARDEVPERLTRNARALRARVAAITGNSKLQVLIQDLENGSFYGDPVRQKRLVGDAVELRKDLHLGSLWIIDTGADTPLKVLAAPHRSRKSIPPPTLTRYVRGAMTGHVVVTESVLRAGRPVLVPLLEVGAQAGRLLLVGGEVLGRGVADDLRSGADMHVTIRSPDGRLVATTFGEGVATDAPDGYETRVVPHRNTDKDPPAVAFAVHFSRAAMERRIQVLVRSAATAAGGAAVLALLLGSLLARRITRPVDALVQATRQVAAGDRDVDLPVGRTDEIGELMDAFAQMIHDLEESEDRLRRAERVAAWQEIAREIAHEIKNPLTPIQMAIETMRRARARNHPSFDEYFEESTRTILEEVDRLKTIVSEFSQFARMPRPNPHDCDLNELIHQSVILYREADEGVTVTEELDASLPELLLDADRMTQVIQNLIKNAMQATRAVDRPGSVLVATRRHESGEVEVTVTDNGCGIPEADLPRVFTPYFTSKAGGTGLGLAVVHRIITGHEGRIGVRSKVGGGTTFVIRLPVRTV